MGETLSAGFLAVALVAATISPAFAQASIAAPPPDAYAPAGQARTAYPGADARQDRIEALESQVQAATAENERLQFQLMQAEREITRLRNMVGELADTNQTIREAPPAPPPPGQQSSNAPATSGLNAAQQARVGTLGSLPPTQSPTPVAAPAGPAAPAVDPVETYRAAQQLLLNNRIAEAEVAFQDFIAANANAPQAPDARFWHAYTLLARNNFASARDAYIDFLQRYPSHARAGEAQIRLGMALVGLGENRMACAAFSDLPRNSARAVRDLAAREARAANCAG